MSWENNTYEDYNFYYHYCKETNTESLLMIDSENENEIEIYVGLMGTPYPFGTFLCKCLNILDNVKDEDSYYFKEIIKYMEKHFSEPRMDMEKCIDSMVTFEDLIKREFYYSNTNELDLNSVEMNQLFNYFNYVELCTENKEFCSIEHLKKFSKIISRQLKQSFYVSPSVDIADRKLRIYEIGALIKAYMQGYYTQKNTSYDLYCIDSLADLIAVSLYHIFNRNHKIGRCEHCNRFFIKQKDTDKYCNGYSLDYPERTCKKQAKLDQQLMRQKEDIYLKYRTIYKRLSRAVTKANDEYTAVNAEKYPTRYAEKKAIYDSIYNERANFLDKSKEFKEHVKSGECTEAEYRKWLDSFYKYKQKRQKSKIDLKWEAHYRGK